MKYFFVFEVLLSGLILVCLWIILFIETQHDKSFSSKCMQTYALLPVKFFSKKTFPISQRIVHFQRILKFWDHKIQPIEDNKILFWRKNPMKFELPYFDCWYFIKMFLKGAFLNFSSTVHLQLSVSMIKLFASWNWHWNYVVELLMTVVVFTQLINRNIMCWLTTVKCELVLDIRIYFSPLVHVFMHSIIAKFIRLTFRLFTISLLFEFGEINFFLSKVSVLLPFSQLFFLA